MTGLPGWIGAASVAVTLLVGAGGGPSSTLSPALGATVETQPRALGTFAPASAADAGCPAESTCSGFVVSCPTLAEDLRGYLAVDAGAGQPRGVVVFFTGGHGTTWWSAEHAEGATLADELRTAGFTIVQVRWGNTWLHSAAGEAGGTAYLGCRPATVVAHIHEEIYLPLGIVPDGPAECGFCISGNSGGATQVAYPLTHYGLEDILDRVIPTGGPPHSTLDNACLAPPDDPYHFPEDTRRFLDRGFGFFDNNGPCKRQDPSFTSRWIEESVSSGGSDYFHPSTAVDIIIGENDIGMQTHARTYFERLQREASPLISWQIVPGTSHEILGTSQGRAALRAAIENSGGTSPQTIRSSITSDRARTSFLQPFTLSGSVTASPGCNEVRSIRVSKQIRGTEPYRQIASGIPVDGDGTWSLEIASKVSASYRAIPSASGCEAVVQDPVTVFVRARIDLSIPSACRTPQRVAGRVRPDHPGTAVILQRRDAGRWRRVDTDRLGADSRFSLVAPSCRGNYRAVWPSQDERNLRAVMRFTF